MNKETIKEVIRKITDYEDAQDVEWALEGLLEEVRSL